MSMRSRRWATCAAAVAFTMSACSAVTNTPSPAAPTPSTVTVTVTPSITASATAMPSATSPLATPTPASRVITRVAPTPTRAPKARPQSRRSTSQCPATWPGEVCRQWALGNLSRARAESKAKANLEKLKSEGVSPGFLDAYENGENFVTCPDGTQTQDECP